MTYEGWKNWQTWNVNLWIDNDAGLYGLKWEQIEQMNTFRPRAPISGEDVRAFVVEFMGGTTPDFGPGDLAEVDFDEIAEHWQIEREDAAEIAA